MNEAKSRFTFKNKLTVKPDELEPGDCLAIKVVAVVGHARDWAAYYGPTGWADEQVANRGSKIDEAAAERLFPVVVWAGLRWRS